MSRMFRSPLMLMALTVFIDITGFGLVLPLLPFWAQHLGANPFGVGMILTSYALAQFIFTPVLGSLSDRYGRRPVIIFSLLVEALSLAFSAIAWTLPILLLARFIGGVGASNIGSAQAVVADTTPPEGRARGMGLIGASIGLGFVIGPAIGGVLAILGTTVPFWVAAVVALVNALLVFRFLPETRTQRTEPSPARVGGASILSSWRRALRSPAVARLVAVNLLFTLAFTAMEAVFPLFTEHAFGWKEVQNGYIFTYVGVIIVIMQGGLVGRLVKRFGEQPLLLFGLGALAVGLLLLPLGTSLGVLLIATGILSIGDGAVTPSSSALLSFAAPVDAQGETLGVAQGAGGLGRVLGPIIAGGLFSLSGPAAPFIVGGLLSVFALLFALPRLPRGTHAKSAAPASVEPGEPAPAAGPAQ